MLAAGISLAEADLADMFEYMGQAVAADILVQRGRVSAENGEPYKAFKRLHWKLKLPKVTLLILKLPAWWYLRPSIALSIAFLS